MKENYLFKSISCKFDMMKILVFQVSCFLRLTTIRRLSMTTVEIYIKLMDHRLYGLFKQARSSSLPQTLLKFSD